MATRDDILEAAGEAQLALAKAIRVMADKASEQGEWAARSAASYAEAYAWLHSPNNSHGGGASPPS